MWTPSWMAWGFCLWSFQYF